MQSKAIELTRLTQVAQDAIEGDAIELTHPFDLGSAGCQALHGLGGIEFDCGLSLIALPESNG